MPPSVSQQLALGRIDQHAEVVRVGDQHVALAVDAQAGRPAVLVHRRLPAADELAVGREDLDAGRHVDDVEQIARVDRHRPRLVEAGRRRCRAVPRPPAAGRCGCGASSQPTSDAKAGVATAHSRNARRGIAEDS